MTDGIEIFLAEFQRFVTRIDFPEWLDDPAKVALFRLWLDRRTIPGPRSPSPKQVRTLYLCLGRGWLSDDEVGDITLLSASQAKTLIGRGFKRRDGGLGFQPPDEGDNDV